MRHARSLAEATPIGPRPAAARPAPPRIPPAYLLDTERPLTRREVEVEAALLRGLALKQAARALGINPDTVRNYVRDIYRKRGVHSRAELIAQFYERTAAVSLPEGAVLLRDQPCAVVLDGALVAGTCTGTFSPSAQP